MALDKLVDSAQLDVDLESVADAIREKGGTSEELSFPNGFVTAIEAIQTGGSGGDSNFSTAKLTIDVSNLVPEYSLPVIPVPIPTISAGGIGNVIYAPINENSEYDIPLYNGKLILYDGSDPYFSSELISGSVTYNPPTDETTPGRYIITGDITYAPTGTLK